MVLQVVVALLLILTTISYFYLKWSFTYWKKRNVLTGPIVYPFGTAKDQILGKASIGIQITKLYNLVKSKEQRYGGYIIFSSPVFVPVDIKLLARMLVTDFPHFTDHSIPVNEKDDPLRGHLFSLTGAKWRVLRNKLTPLFTSGKLKMMFQTFVDCTNDFPCILDNAAKNSEAIDIKDTFARYTTDIIGSVGFGIDCNCLKNQKTEFREYGKKLFETNWNSYIKKFLLSVSPAFFNAIGIKFSGKDIEKFFIRIVKETINHREENNVERKDFMQLLIKLRHQELKLESSNGTKEENGDVIFYKKGLTIEEIAAQAFIFYVAGFETSSTTLTFLMYEIASQIEIQEKLRQEVNSVLKKHDGKITYEAIQEMTYMDQCVYESLRKYPPVSAIPRICTKTYKVPESDLVIEKGTRVVIPVYGIHHDPEYYPDPEKFNPDRFSEENKSKRPPMTFLAFGEGPRFCIGLRMGLLQTKVGLVALLRDYRFTLNTKTPVPIQFSPMQLILGAKGGVWVNVEKL